MVTITKRKTNYRVTEFFSQCVITNTYWINWNAIWSWMVTLWRDWTHTRACSHFHAYSICTNTESISSSWSPMVFFSFYFNHSIVYIRTVVVVTICSTAIYRQQSCLFHFFFFLSCVFVLCFLFCFQSVSTFFSRPIMFIGSF